MRLEQFYYFLKIAQTQSIRRAAEELYLTPQSLSKSILQLEQELQTTLFERSRTGIRLTAEGERAYAMISPIVSQVEGLKSAFPGDATLPSRSLPITLFSCSSMEPFAMGIIRQNMADYPDAAIQVGKMGSLQINQILMAEKNDDLLPDLAMTNIVPKKLDQLREKTKNRYACYLLFEDTLCLQVPQGDKLAALEVIPSRLLVDLPMLLYSPTPTEKTVGELCLAEMGYELKNVSRIADIETTSRIALNLHRYCFVGYTSVEFRPMSGVSYIPLEANLTTENLLLIKRKPKNKALTDAFVRSVDAYYDMKKLW